MKKFENLGRCLNKVEQSKIRGGDEDLANCSTTCYNCIMMAMYCSGECTPNDHGIWCNGTFHACASGNYCS